MHPLIALKIAVALLVPFGLGYFFLWRFSGFASFWTRACLAVGIGFGISSWLFFLWLLLAGQASPLFMILQGVLLIGLALAACLGRKKPEAAVQLFENTVARPLLERRLCSLFFLVLALSISAALLYFLFTPMGDWDAWDLWNMRALFLVKAGSHWRDFFVPENFRAMDYPLMLSSAVAAAWSFVGRQTPWVPGSIALLFTFATVGILTLSLRSLRGASQGWLAGIVLASTPFFAQHGASQYADVELGFYMLASVALWVWNDSESSGSYSKIALSGLLGGMAAWTKNEGMLFFLVVVVARILAKARSGDFKRLTKEISVWLLAALPFLIAIAYFKTQIAPPNDLFHRQSWSDLWSKLTQLSRHSLVLKTWGNNLLSFGRWQAGFPLAAALYAILLGLSPFAKKIRSFPFLVFFLSAAGYYTTYIVTPYDLAWHLGTSITRLFIHLWPLTLFTYFLCLNSPEEWQAEGSRSGSPGGSPTRPSSR